MPDEVVVLGSASGLPTGQRFNAAYALKVAGKLFLLDCGAPVSSLLYRYDLDPLDVDSVFISHWHLDHIAGLGLLLSQNHLLKRTNHLNLYGPRGTRGKINRLLSDSFLLLDELHYPLEVTNVKLKRKYKAGLLRVTFFKTQHLEAGKYKIRFGPRAVACGMQIQGPGWQLLYSGDLTSPQELSPYVAGCDLLIHELAHIRPEEVAEFAAAARVPQVLISHIGPPYNEAPDRITQAFAGRYSGQLTIAHDGMHVLLNNHQ